jgi:hypothetical protein
VPSEVLFGVVAVLGPTTEAAINDPRFAEMVWQLTPASFAVKLSQGRWHPWPYLQLLSRKLMDVASGKCNRLIVVMPPRHGKSELVSKWFPSWYFNSFPSRRIILTSYEAEFAASWGGKVRDILLENQEILRVQMKSNKPAMHHWLTTAGGEMNCSGVGGPITGKGANVFIIDDFVKNAEEARSRVVREKHKEWWTSTARTRLEPTPDGVMPSVIIMATRWDSEDLIGNIIDPNFGSEKGSKEQWEVFCLPALADPESERHYLKYGCVVNNLRLDSVGGKSIKEQVAADNDPGWRDIIGRRKGQALCPDRYDEKDLSMLRGSIGERDWVALFQQRPGDEADDGNVYYNFDEVANCRSLPFDDRLPLFVTLDFNVNPMTALIGQYEMGMGLRFVERINFLEEIYLQNSNTYEMCEKLIHELQKYKRGYLLKVEMYGDAAGTQKSSQSQKTNWQIVQEVFTMDSQIHLQFYRKKTNPAIVDRINSFNSMLKSADGTRRLFINDVRCPHLVTDLRKVKWQTDSSGNTTGLLDKSNMHLTHISDAAGYMVDYRFGLRSRSGGKKGFLQ